LKKYGSEAKWLSGGMSLIPLMKLRLAGPTHLIDLYRWRHLLLQAAHSHRSAGVTHAAVGAIDILLRGVGQVMFQNNPITGLLFLVGIFINSYEYGLTALLRLVVATFAAIAVALSPIGMPALTASFVLTTWVFLLPTSGFRALQRVSVAEVRTPESTVRTRLRRFAASGRRR
jgi:hypothetical protein